MTKKYKEHFLMNTDTIIQYVKDNNIYFDEHADLVASEIGDGNINYVFKVVDRKTNKSVVIKQADKFLRSSGRPLDLHRNKIEAEILETEMRLAPGMVPEIYDYNEDMCALTMEDISNYKNLRSELISGKIFPKLADDITTFMVNTLLPTTDLVMDRAEKKEKVKLFTNIELCDITEDLVFTEPYYDYKGRNIIFDGEEEFVKHILYEDEILKAEVGKLRNSFMNNTQAMIHGDLHSGSIFINEKGLKVIDPEFSCYSIMGYDSGNVIGNLFFSLVNKTVTYNYSKEFIDWIKKTIIDIYDLFYKKLDKKFDKIVTLPLYNREFKKDYIKEIMSDTVGCAGTEMIRRTIGDTKVVEITSVTEHDERTRLDKILILTGVEFIKNRNNITSGKQLIETYKRVVEKL